MVTLFTVREIAIIFRIGFKKYIRSYFNFTDFTCYLLSSLALAMQIFQYFYVERLLQRKKQTDQYISLDWACFMRAVITYINGIFIFMIWIRLLTFLTINRTLTVFNKVLLRSANELIGFTVVLLIFLMAYAECGLALFGVNDVKFCSLSNALISIMSLAGRKFAYQEITDKNKVKTGIYYISFVLIVYVLLVLHVCLGILVAAYDEVSATLQTKKTKVTTVIRMFFISLYDLLYWLIFRKRRVRKKVDIDAEGEWEVDHHLIPQMVSSLTAKRTHSISDPAFLTQDMYLPLRMKRVSTRLHVLEEVLIPVLKRFLRYYNHLRKAQGLNVILFEQLDVDI
ncbi:polycystic kidney disease 2-like 1 protein [Drosophila navojoa]|uniref:polycystic kidney disease 2-like 1 protein n=1 Tax=Drosophila navojoa TaxID=7232 RepID=UPI0011BECEE7|nr:polycystic kidney disease 2-like 1 protein [Drosophila navojoa]